MSAARCHQCGRSADDTMRDGEGGWIGVCDLHDHREPATRLRDDLRGFIEAVCDMVLRDEEIEHIVDGAINITRAHIARGWGR